MSEFISLIERKPHAEEAAYARILRDNKPVMLFGAGAVAVFTLKYLKERGIKPACFCDNNAKKQGADYLGLPVYSYEAFKEKYPGDYYVIITAANMKPIREELIRRGEKEENIVYFADFRDPWSEKTDYEFIVKNQELLSKVYDSLSDDLSKKVFVNVLNCKLSGNPRLIEDIRSFSQYFEEGVIKLGGEEVFFDVGAYTGDTIEMFIDKTKGKYKKITAFEPDAANAALVRSVIEKRKARNVELLGTAAWDKKEKLEFEQDLTGSSGVSTEKISGGKKVTIQADAIDNIAGDEGVTFIKMDIEGSELKALKGAEKTIKKYRPKLAISIYHKRGDMFEIPLLIKSFLPEYRFYVRNYSDIAADTVLYAVK